jgi:hypothetical protein
MKAAAGLEKHPAMFGHRASSHTVETPELLKSFFARCVLAVCLLFAQ